MSKLIIVCGLPGSGKTTLADELSKKTGIACIHKDSIKQRLFESLKCSTLEDSIRLGKPSVDVMMYLAEEQIKNKVDVMIESPLNFEEDYEIFRKWEKDYKLDICSIICFIGKEERMQRMENRERHACHFDLDRKSIGIGTFAKDAEFDYANIPGKLIRLETNKPVDKLVEEVLLNIS